MTQMSTSLPSRALEGFDRGLTIRGANGERISLNAIDCLLDETARTSAYSDETVQGPFEWLRASCAECYFEPYPHLLIDKVFTDEVADGLLSHLEGFSGWGSRSKGLFVLSECDLLDTRLPPEIWDVFSAQRMADLERDVSRLLSEELRLTNVIGVHKLAPEQGLGIHTDGPTRGENFRLSVTLSRFCKPADGGHFIILNKSSASTSKKVVWRGHNLGVVIPLVKSSFHAVSNVEGIPRYSIIFTFAYSKH